MNAPLSRRAFLTHSALAGGGLLIGLSLPSPVRRSFAQEGAAAAPAIKPNAFVRIAPDDTVTIFLKHSEMGQGVATSLPMAVAEELECDWSRVRCEHAPASPDYVHTVYRMQMTGGSTSTWESFDQLRLAGAAAREMLIAAAAAQWGVPASACRAENGFVIHGERRARFGELAATAAQLPVPTSPKLKDPKDWKILGKPAHRLDSPEKITGRAEFGIDVKRPGLLTALCFVWGFAVVADSAQFSAAVSELTDPRYVGTALTIQTSLGFLLTLFTIRMVPPLRDWIGWHGALAILALGPAFGIWSMRRLRRLPEAEKMAGGRR